MKDNVVSLIYTNTSAQMCLPNILDTLRIQDTGLVHLCWRRREEHSAEREADQQAQGWVMFRGRHSAHHRTWKVIWGKWRDFFITLITGIRNPKSFMTHSWKEKASSLWVGPQWCPSLYSHPCVASSPWVWAGPGILYLIYCKGTGWGGSITYLSSIYTYTEYF